MAQLEVTVDRHEFAAYLEHIAEETEHYAILADFSPPEGIERAP